MLPGTGYLLVLYHYGEHGFMSYMSSGNRADCVRLLGEMLEKFRSEQS
jgi:hypothetical protein